MTILENNLHLKPRQTRGTELYRFRNYVALGVVTVGTLVGLAINYSSITQSAFEYHSNYIKKFEQPVEYPGTLRTTSKKSADLLNEYKENIDLAKYY